MDAQRIAVDGVIAGRLYLAGLNDPKRLAFKDLQAMARA
jgi:hypothetical protein